MKHTLFFSTPSHRATHANFGARGFTLIELMVVLAVVAIVSAITLGGFKEMREGNKRVSCQTNLSQIYQASRLYAADEGGKLPFYDNPCTSASYADNQVGIGLWALYTFPDKKDLNGDTKTSNQIAPFQVAVTPPTVPATYKETNTPISRYLRSSRSLHCPSDNSDNSEKLYNDSKSEFNPYYLSYQTCDSGAPKSGLPGVPGVATYATQRTTDTSNPNLWKRQLLHYKDPAYANLVSRQPTGDTVVAYCLFHRNQRDADNVLFYDGSVQTLARNYNGETDWKRLPKAPQ